MKISPWIMFSAALLSAGVAAAAESRDSAQWKQRLSQLAKPAADEVVLTAVGDAIWNRSISAIPAPALQSLFEVMRSGDISFVNFEQMIFDKGFPVNGAPAQANPSIMEDFKWAGVDMVSLGNNHQWDYGQPGMEMTQQTLDAAGIKHAGTGRNITEAFKATQFEAKGLKIALVSALVSPTLSLGHGATADSAGVALIRGAETRRVDGTVVLSPFDDDLKALEASIKEARKIADVVAVSLHFHWGDAEAVDPAGRQLIVHTIIDAGGDIVLGHGPHVLNGIEIYKGKPIVYSMGNFVFQQRLSDYRFFPDSVKILTPMLADAKQHEGFMVRLVMSTKGQFRRMEVLPVDLKDEGTPRLIADKSADQILDRVNSLSQPFGTQIKRENWYSVVDLSGRK